MQLTKIQWTDLSVNPIRANMRGGSNRIAGHYCEKISAGCKLCYSSKTQPRFGMPEFQEQRRDDVDVFLDSRQLDKILRRRKPAKVFWCDMTDMFGHWVPDEWIDQCLAVMALTPHLTHQVLTKRSRRLREHFAPGRDAKVAAAAKALYSTVTPFVLPSESVFDGRRVARGEAWEIKAWPLESVHLGVSCEDQATADERIPDLLATPAAVRWVSAEPLLSGIDFTRVNVYEHIAPSLLGGAIAAGRSIANYPSRECWWYNSLTGVTAAGERHEHLDWIVVGGESGPGARPFDLAWARRIIADCRTANVLVFMKQLGARPYEVTSKESVSHHAIYGPEVSREEDLVDLRLKSRKGGDMAEWPTDVRIREFPK